MPVDPNSRVGLALGGGVVRGLAHVGVLSVLEEAGIRVGYVAGTSAGSLIGAFYAAGWPVARIRRMAGELSWRRLARLVWPRRGFFSFDPLAAWLAAELGNPHFSDLLVPFAAVSTDLETGQAVAVKEGRVAPAVQASCSVPGAIQPVALDGRLLGDGCLSDTVPVGVLRKMGAEVVIGVDIFTPKIRPRWGPLGMALNALEILLRRAGGGGGDADCLISPGLGGSTYVRFSRREELIRLGEAAACQKLPEILAVVEDQGVLTV